MSAVYFQVTVIGRFQGQDLQNTYYYNDDSPGPQLGGNAFADDDTTVGMALKDAFITAWQGVYTGISVDSAVYSQLRISALWAHQPANRVSFLWPVTWNSGRAVDGLASSCSAIVTRRWGNGQRRFNGRVYYGGIAKDDVVGGVIQAGTPTWAAMTTAATTMVATLFQPPYRFLPAVVNPRIIPPAPLGFSGRTVRVSVPVPVLATQRRRRPGHGRRG